jgi:hypothetical protein
MVSHEEVDALRAAIGAGHEVIVEVELESGPCWARVRSVTPARRGRERVTVDIGGARITLAIERVRAVRAGG